MHSQFQIFDQSVSMNYIKILGELFDLSVFV
jgi:hypothetical protein